MSLEPVFGARVAFDELAEGFVDGALAQRTFVCRENTSEEPLVNALLEPVRNVVCDEAVLALLLAKREPGRYEKVTQQQTYSRDC